MQSASMRAPQRASTGGGNMTPGLSPTAPHLAALASPASFPPALVPLFSFHVFLPHQLLHLILNETYILEKHEHASGEC